MTQKRLPLEQDVQQSRVLVADYVVRCRLETPVTPGMGSVSRAIDQFVRYIAGQPNIDPRSIRFFFKED